MPSARPTRVIISGGGTGGHIFPAIAIANALKKIENETEILFVGAEGKMEMKKVPEAGYKIEGLWISGFHRKKMWRNIMLPFKVISSLTKSYRIMKNFKPDLAVGVGGYASGPLLQVANWMGVPALIQEQNGYPGVTNKLLSKKVQKICVVYENMDKYFPAEKIIITGNPVRDSIVFNRFSKADSYDAFGLDLKYKTVLVTGGSLGAASINRVIAGKLDFFVENKIQLIWQTGELYIDDYKHLAEGKEEWIKIMPFVKNMAQAYRASDVVVTRAGGIISELSISKKASILIPSPNVAEDHQTFNAKALVKEDAAILVRDDEMEEQLCPEIISVITNDEKREALEENIGKLAIPDAARRIAIEVLKMKKDSNKDKA